MNVTRGLAAAVGREAMQLMDAGVRELAAAALTPEITGTSHHGSQQAVMGRALVLPVRLPDLTVALDAPG